MGNGGHTTAKGVLGDALGGLNPPGYTGMISRGLREGWLQPWNLKPAECARVVDVMTKLAEGGCDKAASVLARMHATNVRLAEMVDKTERLDAGKETDRIGLVDERIAASLKANGRKDLKDSLGG